MRKLNRNLKVPMSNERAKKLLYQAKYVVFTLLGRHQDTDDIAHAVLLHFLEGKGGNQKVQYAVIDKIREIYGRTDRKAVIKPSRDSFNQASSYKMHLVAAEDITGEEFEGRIDQYVKDLVGYERATLVLLYLWGLSLGEIGHCFGVSESRVCQIKLIAETLIMDRMKEEDKVRAAHLGIKKTSK